MLRTFDLPLDLSFKSNFDLDSTPSLQSSSYWKVPDKHQYLTSLTVNHNENLCAVASGAAENNLFIYELGATNKAQLTHHQTISLPYIHSMQWVPTNTGLGSSGNVLMSGHRNGLVYMTMLPDTWSVDQPAEIRARFNHLHHIGNSTASTRIRQLELVMDGCSVNYIGSICADNVFLWDPSRWDIPRLKLKQRNINCFDVSKVRNGIAAFGSRKGISIADFRRPGGTLSPPDGNDYPVTLVRWSPTNENLVAAADTTNTINIWDIRNSKPLYTYNGHIDQVTGIEWSPDRSSELVSASHDGTIRVWDMRDHSNDCVKPLTVPTSRKWAHSDGWKSFQDRQDMFSLDTMFESPLISNTNKQFFGLKLFNDAALTIDSSGRLGYHNINTSPLSPVTSASESSDNDFNPPSP